MDVYDGFLHAKYGFVHGDQRCEETTSFPRVEWTVNSSSTEQLERHKRKVVNEGAPDIEEKSNAQSR